MAEPVPSSPQVTSKQDGPVSSSLSGKRPFTARGLFGKGHPQGADSVGPQPRRHSPMHHSPRRFVNPHLLESCAWGRLRFHSAERETLSPSGCVEKLEA